MFDHVTIRVADLDASPSFYTRVFELLEFGAPPTEGDGFTEWNQFSIAQAEPDRPVTRGLHVGFAARDRAHVDSSWRALVEAGYRSDGEPGPRPQYGPEYYGAFVFDPDGNSVEAVHNHPERRAGAVDHLWIRVRDAQASKRFYETIAPVVGFEVRVRPPDRVQFLAEHGTFSVVEGEPTKNVHFAFPAADRLTVDVFHRVAVAAGYSDNGAPGERPEYHDGYYAAYVLDPDGHNVEAVFHDQH